MFSYTASRSDSLWKFKCYPNRRVLDLFTRVKLCTAVSAPAAWWHLSWHWHRPGQKSTGTLLPLSPLCWSKFSQAKSFRNSIAYEMEDGGRLNNNVLIFDPGHWFLVSCLQVYLVKKTILSRFPMQEMMTNYSPSVYEANGPQLITRVFNSLTGDWNCYLVRSVISRN